MATEATTLYSLSLRLCCPQTHMAPFTPVKQDDFLCFLNFFHSEIKTKQAEKG